MKKFLTRLHVFVSGIPAFCGKIADDVLILAGCWLVVYATYRLSLTAAIYVAGGMMIVSGVVIGLGQKGGKQ